MTTFAELTTTRVGGRASNLIAPATRDELIAAAREAFGSGEPYLFVGGGSNLIVSDHGFDGTVIRVVTKGIRVVAGTPDDVGVVHVRVEAGESWTDFVDYAVAQNWVGIEALAGIPGSVGAAPVQNIGAYGQEVSHVVTQIEFLDADTGELEWIDVDDLELGYRTSIVKRGDRRGLVTRVEFRLVEYPDAGEGFGAPVVFEQLAKALGVEHGTRVHASRVRDAVIRLRASKGMVLDHNDADTASSGSFFVNPVVSRDFAVGLPEDAPRYPAPDSPDGTPLVKLSAAWLIEHAGVRKGFALPGSGAAISSKHTLAITNRGEATAEDIAELARYVRSRVLSEFGVRLMPEPVLVGIDL